MAARRDLDGDLLGIAAEAGERARPESMMHIEIDRQADPHLLDELAAALTRVLAEVRLAVEDWRAMRRACLDAIADLAPGRSPNLAEYEDFLRWLEANHFTFLGHRRYRYVDDPAQPGGLRYELIAGSALGILRRDEVRLFESGLGGGEAMARFARGPQNILIVKTDRPSLVHRIGPMDCVIVKTYDADGRVTGERRLAGLFTSAAYHALVQDVPLLRGRVDGILRRSGLDANSHDGKALLAILESYPRDELFQIEEDTLYDHALGILQLQERRRVALFARRDAVGRFATCLVFAPRERFDASAQRPLRRHPRAGVARQGDVGRLLDQQRFGARPVALHAEARGQRYADARPCRARAGARRGRDLVERPPARRPAGASRRGRGPRRRPPLARLVPLGLSRQFRCRTRRWPTSARCRRPWMASRSACVSTASPARPRIASPCACSIPRNRSRWPTSCRRRNISGSGC